MDKNIWRGWRKWILISVAIVVLGGVGVWVWWEIGTEDRVVKEDVEDLTDRTEIGKEVLDRAWVRIRKGDSDALVEALHIFDDAFRDQKNEEIKTEILIRMGVFLYDLSLYQEALATFLQANARDKTPDQAVNIYSGLSLVFRVLGDEENADRYAILEAEAIEAWRRSVES